mmetsp:Transcript_17891/g.41010  ORF Transcript_17891/g.41010 Transcript_17891/m.41010 type:complete len:197 (-) Transcript_17891:8-598(-)
MLRRAVLLLQTICLLAYWLWGSRLRRGAPEQLHTCTLVRSRGRLLVALPARLAETLSSYLLLATSRVSVMVGAKRRCSSIDDTLDAKLWGRSLPREGAKERAPRDTLISRVLQRTSLLGGELRAANVVPAEAGYQVGELHILVTTFSHTPSLLAPLADESPPVRDHARDHACSRAAATLASALAPMPTGERSSHSE